MCIAETSLRQCIEASVESYKAKLMLNGKGYRLLGQQDVAVCMNMYNWFENFPTILEQVDAFFLKAQELRNLNKEYANKDEIYDELKAYEIRLQEAGAPLVAAIRAT